MNRTIGLAGCYAIAMSLGFAGDSATQAIGYDNVHIRVADPAKAVEWYVKYMGATAPSVPGRILFGDALIAVVKTTDPKPSAGSVIDHIGLSYSNLDAKMKELEGSGAKVLNAPREIPGLFKVAFIEDPWGIKIELVQDPELLGFHHVHLRVPDPAASLQWFQQMIGGERGKLKGKIDGLRFGNVWVLAASSNKEVPAPSAERAVMSFGVDVSKIDQSVAALKAKGVKFAVEPRPYGNDLVYAFAEDPNGIRFELLQHSK